MPDGHLDFTIQRLGDCRVPSPLAGVRFTRDDERVLYHASLQDYRFAPHFARTMPRVNFAIKGSPLSDHNPMTIDLPFGEPPPARR